MATSPNLSLVIPLYNEAERFDRLRRGVQDFGRLATDLACELVLVNDGSQDDTPGLMAGLKEELESAGGREGGVRWEVRLISLPRNQGKGGALRAGVMAARGQWVLTLDADMACPPSQLLEWQERGYVNLRQAPDPRRVFYGCREHPQSRVNDQTYRRLMGKVFNTLVQTVTDLALDDTQCGFKLYPLATAQRCFGLVANWGWAHDVEISKVLVEMGCLVQALPVTWTAIAGSKIRPLSDALRMFLEVLRIETNFVLRFRLGLGRPGDVPRGGLLYQRLSLLLGLGLLLVVLFTFQDYGFTADERVQAEYGQGIVRYYASGFSDRSVLDLKSLYLYGGLFEALAQVFSKLLPWGQYQARHLLTALVGLLGIAGAWRMAQYLAGPRAAFWAAALLAATPLYYGHMFNNSKDVPFAVAYVWSAYYLLRAMEHLPRVPRGLALKLGLALGACLGIRVGGAVLVGYMGLLTALWAAGQLRVRPIREVARDLLTMFRRWYLPAGVIAYALMLLAWPWAQKNPFYNPLFALWASTQFGHNHLQLFAGLYYCSLSLPRSYIPTYLLYTLPEAFLLALAGLGSRRAWRPPAQAPSAPASRPWLAYACLLAATVLPPALVMVNRSTLYDGLRHLIFIVPPLAVLGGMGLHGLVGLAGGYRRWAAQPLSCCLVLALLHQAGLMARLHPYEYLYFNSLIGGLQGAQGRYELDYGGATYAEALLKLGEIIRREEAAGQGPRQQTYKVYFRGGNGEVMPYLGPALPPSLKHTGRPLEADFHVDFTRWDFHLATNGVTLATVERLGVPLNYIKDLRPLASKAYQARNRLCERDFQPTGRIPLE